MPTVPFADFGVKWFQDIVKKIISWFRHELVGGYEALSSGFLGTPLPDGQGTALVFAPPADSDQPWHSIYESVVGGEVMILALIILFLAVQGRHFVNVFDVGDAYETRRATNRAWLGATLVVAWYWLGVLALYFVQGLTIAITPDVSVITGALVDLLPVALGSPILTLMMASMGGLAVVALQAVLFIREVLLYVYLYAMPVGIALAFGNLPVLSDIARRMIRRFVPLAVLPLPVAVLLRGYELLFVGDPFVGIPTAFLKYLVVVSLPLLALVVTWKTFSYASPLTARVLGGGTRAAATLGTLAVAGYAAGPKAAATAARFGPKAGATHAATQQAFGSNGTQNEMTSAGTSHDNVASEGGNGGVPAYRRRENDPGYY